jgi:hypothetical protein
MMEEGDSKSGATLTRMVKIGRRSQHEGQTPGSFGLLLKSSEQPKQAPSSLSHDLPVFLSSQAQEN